MSLTQLECVVDEEIAEELSAFLEEDALAVTWYEKTQGHWVLQAVVDSSKEVSLGHKMTSFFKEKDMSPPNIKSAPLPQEDWVAAVYRDSPPLTLGRFYIYGSHIQDDPPSGLLPLCIDAATAFGSGQHESTEGCLKALSLLAEKKSYQSPLDMGCGSGILALAMARLWHTPVLACDNDPESVRVTLENAHLNQLDSLITAQLSEGFTALQGKTFDIITANILAGPLSQMAGDASRALVPGGYIVLAGLLSRQAEGVVEAYQNAGVELVEQLVIGEWSTLIMRKEHRG
jgi:ribosomal protein L11 methyltransferase